MHLYSGARKLTVINIQDRRTCIFNQFSKRGFSVIGACTKKRDNTVYTIITCDTGLILAPLWNAGPRAARKARIDGASLSG